MAYHYARFGAQIVITARREKVLQQVAEKCLSLGAQKALYIAADMGNDSDPEKVVDFALEKLGGLDYLVNFFSYVQMAWKALDSLEQSKGSLVIVSSLLGKMASPFTAPYTSTKFALNGFFGALHHELAMKKSNVSISICTLGLIDTDSAMEKVRGITDVPAYPATDAALNIIITGATRQQELFYPWITYVATLSKDWFPPVTNYFIQSTYNLCDPINAEQSGEEQSRLATGAESPVGPRFWPKIHDRSAPHWILGCNSPSVCGLGWCGVASRLAVTHLAPPEAHNRRLVCEE
ncbi:hypothetical protein INR49_030284, partial [Caranx melampygus]